MKFKQLYSVISQTAWLIEPQRGIALYNQWLHSSEKGISIHDDSADESEETSYTAFQKLFAAAGVVVAPDNSYDLRNNFAGFDGAKIAVIPIEGAIMKYDSCGWLGTNSYRNITKMAENTPSVETIIFLIDSPGGSVNGTEALASDIKASKKRTIALADGMMASAAYWIGSSCKEVYATTASTLIGSIGTMITVQDKESAQKYSKMHTFYATDSTEKNKAYELATTGDGKMIIEQLLDPLNNVFVSSVKSSRPAIAGHENETLKGQVYLADKAKALGLIDGIQTLQQLTAATKQVTSKSNFNMKVFQHVLVAANATAFAVVDGGFLLEETHLTALEEKLSQDATIIKGLTAQLNSAGPSAEATAEIEQLKKDLAEAKTALTAAEDAKATAEKALEQEKKKPGANFTGTQGDKNGGTGSAVSEKLAAINEKFNKEIDGR